MGGATQCGGGEGWSNCKCLVSRHIFYKCKQIIKHLPCCVVKGVGRHLQIHKRVSIKCSFKKKKTNNHVCMIVHFIPVQPWPIQSCCI